jgi:hypothetical protein
MRRVAGTELTEIAPIIGQPNGNFSNGNFGQITTTLPFTYRQVELGLRVTF